MREGKPLPYGVGCILFVGEDIILPLKLVGGNLRTVELRLSLRCGILWIVGLVYV